MCVGLAGVREGGWRPGSGDVGGFANVSLRQRLILYAAGAQEQMSSARRLCERAGRPQWDKPAVYAGG
jgi:hypothetical protein